MPSNVSLVEGDYNDLSQFKTGCYDLVFAVETICHNVDKNNVIKQVSRIIKPGGLFIIFDIYEPLLKNKMTNFQRRVSSITLAGMRVTDKDQYIGDTKSYLSQNNFHKIEIKNLTRKIQPNLKKPKSFLNFIFYTLDLRGFYEKYCQKMPMLTVLLDI